MYQELTDSFWYLKDTYSSQENESSNQTLLDETDDFLEFWNKNYKHYHEQNERKQDSCSANNGMQSKNFNSELEKILNHVPPLPSYLQGTGGKKMNYTMIATTLDPGSIIEHLGKTFDKTSFQAFPLSFGVQTMAHIFEEPFTVNKSKQNAQLCDEHESTRQLKRKTSEPEDEEQRPTFENQAELLQLKSKTGKKSRMSWMTTKTIDLDEEDKDLEQQIKMLIQTRQL